MHLPISVYEVVYETRWPSVVLQRSMRASTSRYCRELSRGGATELPACPHACLPQNTRFRELGANRIPARFPHLSVIRQSYPTEPSPPVQRQNNPHMIDSWPRGIIPSLLSIATALDLSDQGIVARTDKLTETVQVVMESFPNLRADQRPNGADRYRWSIYDDLRPCQRNSSSTSSSRPRFLVPNQLALTRPP
jgi:hypothetical protein